MSTRRRQTKSAAVPELPIAAGARAMARYMKSTDEPFLKGAVGKEDPEEPAPDFFSSRGAHQCTWRVHLEREKKHPGLDGPSDAPSFVRDVFAMNSPSALIGTSERNETRLLGVPLPDGTSKNGSSVEFMYGAIARAPAAIVSSGAAADLACRLRVLMIATDNSAAKNSLALSVITVCIHNLTNSRLLFFWSQV